MYFQVVRRASVWACKHIKELNGQRYAVLVSGPLSYDKALIELLRLFNRKYDTRFDTWKDVQSSNLRVACNRIHMDGWDCWYFSHAHCTFFIDIYRPI